MYNVRIIIIPKVIKLQPAIEIVRIVKSTVAHSAVPVKAIFKASSMGCNSISRDRLAEQEYFCGGAKYCNQN